MNADRTTRALPLLVLGGLALVAAVWAGLVRLGWGWPPLLATLPAAHGPLMVCGFLGTVIGLERAVALGRGWAFVGPLLTGLGTLALIFGAPEPVAPVLMTLGSAWLVAVFVPVLRRHAAIHTAVMTLGAALWLAGNLVWLVGRPVAEAVPWWIGFLLLTVAGERLELSRVLRPTPRVRYAFAAACGLVILALVVTLADLDLGSRLLGAGMTLLALWLLRFDIARRTVRLTGLPRFIAVCLLAGYVWLAVSGLLYVRYGGVTAGLQYDAILHAFFLGFVFNMLFGHAPIVIPALAGVTVRYTPGLYLHVALLNASLALRVVGDLAMWLPGRKWGGLLNAAAMVVFVVAMAVSVLAPAAPPEGDAGDP